MLYRGQSFRARLAARFTVTMALAIAAISTVTLLVLRASLDRELDASILNVASIQAASLTDSPGGAMHFHEWELTPEEAASVRELNRYAQVWSAEGASLLRSQYMTADLPLDPVALRTAAAGELTWREADFAGVPIRSLYYPLGRLGESHDTHVLQVAAPLTGRHALLAQGLVALLGIGSLVVLGSYFGSRWLAGTAVRPVHDIIDQAESIEAGSPVRISAHAELAEYRRLVSTLNTMLERLQRAFHAQRRFTADASHELRTPLTVLRGELELALRRAREPEEYEEVLQTSLEEVLRLARITDQLLLLARTDSGVSRLRLVEGDLGDVVHESVERVRPEAAAKGVSVTASIDSSAVGTFDADLVGQVAWNLLHNAVKFTPTGGEVRVTVESDSERVGLVVEDSGPGLGPEASRVFERFYQADRSRTPGNELRGHGLGLSIVQAIVEAHGGRVHAEASALGGASVVVSLPRTADSPRDVRDETGVSA